jgi:hypothetical protein
MGETASDRRWYHLTPGHFLIGLLAVEGILLAAQWLRWLHKGYGVLIALAAVGAFLVGMLLWFAAALIFRLRFQFSLRSLFVLTLAVAVPCSWLTTEMKWAREQKAVIEEIRSAGATTRNLSSRDPSWLWEWLGDDFFADGIYVVESNEASLQYFNRLAEVRWLSLRGDGVTDAGLGHLSGLTQLRSLSIKEARITDAGLEHLEGLARLEYLDLEDTKVTDAGLEHLNGLTQLHMLHLIGTRVTDAGVRKLQKALPNCKIHWYYPPAP